MTSDIERVQVRKGFPTWFGDPPSSVYAGKTGAGAGMPSLATTHLTHSSQCVTGPFTCSTLVYVVCVIFFIE